MHQKKNPFPQLSLLPKYLPLLKINNQKIDYTEIYLLLTFPSALVCTEQCVKVIEREGPLFSQDFTVKSGAGGGPEITGAPNFYDTGASEYTHRYRIYP